MSETCGRSSSEEERTVLFLTQSMTRKNQWGGAAFLKIELVNEKQVESFVPLDWSFPIMYTLFVSLTS